MKKINKNCIEACYDHADSVVIKKNELKSLYRKIREYEQILDMYKKEKQHFMKLLRNGLS
jgi:inorganic pyrophosphatase